MNDIASIIVTFGLADDINDVSKAAIISSWEHGNVNGITVILTSGARSKTFLQELKHE